ncbi:hypothetical protein ACFWY9_42575 [Amycolatopsis sp. NPDC059027]|uniref:hypothetical protein n=1 Tax=Amycolatopsis sp. NPDC059027 TaxID=3346709 RepID=UPI0036705D31
MGTPDRSGTRAMAVLLLAALAVLGPGMIIWGVGALSLTEPRCGNRTMSPEFTCRITRDGTDGWVSSSSRQEKANDRDPANSRTYQQMEDDQRATGRFRIGVGVACVVIDVAVLTALAVSSVRRRAS